MSVFWSLGEGFQLVRLPLVGHTSVGLEGLGIVRVVIISVICSMWNVGVWLIFLLLGCVVEGLSLLSVPLW